MPTSLLRSALFASLVPCLVLTGCSKVNVFGKKKAPQPALAPASDPATASATSFSVTIVETDGQRRGTIANGSFTLNAPLAQATSGTWSLNGTPSRGLLHAGKTVASTLQAQRKGQLSVRHSGVLTILTVLDKEGQPLFRIMGPPHGNAIKDHWYHLGNDSGLATVSPRT